MLTVGINSYELASTVLYRARSLPAKPSCLEFRSAAA
jgi:hypothetical protein